MYIIYSVIHNTPYTNINRYLQVIYTIMPTMCYSLLQFIYPLRFILHAYRKVFRKFAFVIRNVYTKIKSIDINKTSKKVFQKFNNYYYVILLRIYRVRECQSIHQLSPARILSIRHLLYD